MGARIDALKKRLKTIHCLQEAAAVLSWDQETGMPPGASEARAAQLAALSEVAHGMLIADETGQALEDAAAEVDDPEGVDGHLVQVTRRKFERETKLPAALVADLAAATSRAQVVWTQAKRSKDFPLFLPHLERVVDLVGQVAEAYGYEDHPYDGLLEGYEPGMRTARLRVLFDDMRPRLVGLVDRIRQAPPLDASVLHQEYDVELQRSFARRLAADVGYDFERGRLDEAEHPFCISFSSRDVRITNAYDPNYLARGLFGCLHETGHALYEQGSPASFDHTPLEGGCSMGVHESQSRLWENFVGRSRGFWAHYLPLLARVFPAQLGSCTLDTFHRAINKVQPSLIRVEADEVTYNLHVMLRFQVELALLEGSMKPAEIPEAWNAGMKDYLGLTPPDDGKGCLQDVHWSIGLFAYFPTYTLGNLLAAQLWERARADLGDLEGRFAEGRFEELLGWLRERIHEPASRHLPEELVRRATGRDLEAAPFTRYLEERFSNLYGLS